MRKVYQKPVEKLIDNQYNEQIKAESYNCDRVIFQAVTKPGVLDCRDYRQYTEVTTFSLSDPCKEESPFHL